MLCYGCSSFNAWKNLPTSENDQRTVYVVSHGWHTGIVLGATDLGKPLNFIKAQLGESKYYEFGWGDKGFYQADEINTFLVLKAVFWPSDSIMHVVSLTKDPARYFPQDEVIALRISSKGLTGLQHFIAESFKRNSAGETLKIGPGIYGKSLFFDSDTPYHLAHTCNTWVAEAIAKTGAPISSFLTLRAKSVMSQIAEAKQKFQCCPL